MRLSLLAAFRGSSVPIACPDLGRFGLAGSAIKPCCVGDSMNADVLQECAKPVMVLLVSCNHPSACFSRRRYTVIERPFPGLVLEPHGLAPCLCASSTLTRNSMTLGHARFFSKGVVLNGRPPLKLGLSLFKMFIPQGACCLCSGKRAALVQLRA